MMDRKFGLWWKNKRKKKMLIKIIRYGIINLGNLSGNGDGYRGNKVAILPHWKTTKTRLFLL